MNPTLIFILLLLFITLIGIINAMFVKHYYDTQRYIYLFLIILTGIAWYYLFYISYGYQNFALLNILISVLAIIAAAVVGVLYFKNKINMWQYLGIALIIIGIVLLNYFNEEIIIKS